MTKKNDDGIRPYGHPGKFEGELLVTSWLYRVLGDGGADEETGGEGLGWYGIFRMPTKESRRQLADDLDKVALEEDGEHLTSEERAMISQTPAIIMNESDQGFFSAKYYDKMADADRDWKEIVDEYDEITRESEESY
jgi:hypothetical protein